MPNNRTKHTSTSTSSLSAHDKLLGKKSNIVEDQLSSNFSTIDRNDPLYDSQAEDNYFYAVLNLEGKESYQMMHSSIACSGYESVISSIRFAHFAEAVSEILNEFFINKDAAHVCSELKALDTFIFPSYFVYCAIRTSMDKTQQDREKTSALLTILVSCNLLTEQHLIRGIEKLILSVEDLLLDVPYATDYLYTFIECAIDDKCIPPSFLSRLPEIFLTHLTSVNVEPSLSQLQKYKKRVKRFGLLFFEDGTLEIASDFLSEEAEIPFRHEFVRLMISESLEKKGHHREMVSDVLGKLYGDSLNAQDIQFAFGRLIAAIGDLSLDTVDAEKLLSLYLVRSVNDEILPPAFLYDAYLLHFGGFRGMAVLKRALRYLYSESLAAKRIHSDWNKSDAWDSEFPEFDINVSVILDYFLSGSSESFTVKTIQSLQMSSEQASELITKLLVTVLKASSDYPFISSKSLSLIKELVDNSVVERATLGKGLSDVYTYLHLISVDLASSQLKVKEFIEQSISMNLLPTDFTPPL